MFSVDISRQSPPPLRYFVPILQRLANKVLFRYCGGLKIDSMEPLEVWKVVKSSHFPIEKCHFLTFWGLWKPGFGQFWGLWKPGFDQFWGLRSRLKPRFGTLENLEKPVTGAESSRYEFYTVWRSHDCLRRNALVRLSWKQRIEKLAALDFLNASGFFSLQAFSFEYQPCYVKSQALVQKRRKCICKNLKEACLCVLSFGGILF